MDDQSDQLEWYKDEWQLMSDELGQAMDDLQEEEYIHKLSRAEVVGLRIKLRYAREEATIQNKTITERAVALSNLVDEYDRIFARYVSLTGTKLITNRLNELRKQAGYSQRKQGVYSQL